MTVKHLSASGLKNYLSCPFKFKLQQLERLRLIVPRAYFAFGRAVHKGIEKRVTEKSCPVAAFQESWRYEEVVDLQYNSRENHQVLLDLGSRMLQAWSNDATTNELLESPANAEVPLSKTEDGVPLYGIVDFISETAVIDWKTASSEYGDEKALDLQLPFYSLLIGNPELLYGFGVLIKNKNPRVQYLFLPIRDTEKENLKELIKRAWEGITAGKFPRIPNSTCSFCDYLPLCLGKEGADNLYISVQEEDVE